MPGARRARDRTIGFYTFFMFKAERRKQGSTQESMGNVNFVELAEFCKKEVIEFCDNPRKNYLQTYYAAISEDDSMIVSSTPHILSNASRCILIHAWRALAMTIWYDTYKVQYIDENGAIRENIDGNFSIHIRTAEFNNPSVMYLRWDDTILLSTRRDFSGMNYYKWDMILPDVWKLYLKCKKECSTLREMKFLCDLMVQKQDMAILQNQVKMSDYSSLKTQIERDAYKKLLDEIKEMVESR